MKSDTLITAYVGAYPGGRPAPDLGQVPVSTDDNFAFIFASGLDRTESTFGAR